ncbi:helix-turn-helix domain-containing protein [Wenyingzhuangia sp. IMCC45467]
MRLNLNNIIAKEEKVLKTVPYAQVNVMERSMQIKEDQVQGIIQHIRLNGLCFFANELKVAEEDLTLVFHGEPAFKLHFEVGGTATYRFDKKFAKCLELTKGMYNLLYVTQHDEQIVNTKNNSKSIELFFTKAFLEEITGKEFIHVLEMLEQKSYKKNLDVLTKGLFISEEMLSIINDILYCNYEGVKRRVFLELKIKELLIVAMSHYVATSVTESMDAYDVKSLKQVEEHIKKHLKEEMPIVELAILAGLNTSKLKKAFKAVYGTTIFKYITSLRIDKAKDLIQKENYTISQASYEVGYKNPQHFTVAFKKKLGYLPSQLKKNLYQILYLTCVNDFEFLVCDFFVF